ncbi:MAG: phage Gp37/Gp68 family protein [Magnetococcus sp. YQC-5]
MGANSKISWTHHTFNAWWGCAKISAGCANCYAEGVARRFGHDVWGKDAPRRFFGWDHWQEPFRWNEAAKKAGERHRVFCGSMCDVFEDRLELYRPRNRLFEMIESTPYLDWLLLTKRPENIPQLIGDAGQLPENVWMGATVEGFGCVKRIDALLEIPVKVRFLSLEPLLSPLYLDRWLDKGINWVIVGGESGPKARQMRRRWVVDIRDQCLGAGVPFYFKQWGASGEDGKRRSVKANGCLLGGREWKEFPCATTLGEHAARSLGVEESS